MTKYIRTAEVTDAGKLKKFKYHFHRGIIAAVTSVVAIIASAIVISIVNEKSFYNCESLNAKYASGWVYADYPEDALFPYGMICNQWQFDFFKDPPCSCVFVFIDTCAWLEYDPSLTLRKGHQPLIYEDDLRPPLDHVDHARILHMKSSPPLVSGLSLAVPLLLPPVAHIVTGPSAS